MRFVGRVRWTMRNLFFILAIAAVCCALWATVAAGMIANFLEKKGIKTPFFLFRIYLFRNLRNYKEITVQETGRPGPLYYQYIIPINAALILGLAALAIKLL